MNTPLRVAIVDDEPLARRRIARLLAQAPAVRVVAICENAKDLSQALRTQRVDALFLDIEMPGCDGFSALTHLPAPRPRVVFVTAYPNYATRAFDIDATDYLLKPVSEERLLASVERIRRDLAATPKAVDAPHPSIDAYPQRLSFAVGNRMRLIETETIDHILVEANYIEVRSTEGCFVLRRPIGWIQARLDPARFLRIHRSHIVRMGAIVQVAAATYGCYKLTLRNGEQLGSSRSYRDRIRAALQLGAG